MSVSYSSRREHSINNPRRQSGDPQDSHPHLSVPEGRALSNPRRQSGDPPEVPHTLLSASRRDALSNDNRDNADNWLSATRTELGCRIMLSVISNTNYHELTIN